MFDTVLIKMLKFILMIKFPFSTSPLKCVMSVVVLPGEMLGACSRLRPLPLSLVWWCMSCNNKNDNNSDNNKIIVITATFLEDTLTSA